VVSQPETPGAANVAFNNTALLDSTYLHFVNYDNTATKYCVAASPRHTFFTYKWW
jgi:hypothetical protein